MLRKLILKLLLGSLALAAVAGVLTVLLQEDEIVFRVMITGFSCALAAVLLIGFSLLVDRPSLRVAGLAGMGAVMVEFLFALVAIWLRGLLPGSADDKLAMSMVMIAVTMIIAVVYLLAAGRPGNRAGGIGGVITVAAAIVLFGVAIWLPGNYWQHDEWWASGWAVLGYGVTITASLCGVVAGRRLWWQLAAVASALIGIGLSLVAIWTHRNSENSICLFSTVAALGGLANLTLLARLRGGQVWVRIGTLVAAFTTAILLNLIVIGDHEGSEMLGRLLSASGIVTSCGALAIVVLAALNRRSRIEPGPRGMLTHMTIHCPSCERKQQAPIGRSSCEHCGLGFDLRVAEPRCPNCDYLVYRNESGRCPECGHRLEAAG